MFPQLLQPKVLSFRNRWRRTDNLLMQCTRDGIIAALTVGIMIGTYLGGLWFLEQTETLLDFAYFHPSLTLGLVLVFLLLMLFVTNLVSALGALFMSRDLDLVLSSPLTSFRFFRGKLVEVLLTSSWMTIVFLVPLVLAFGSFYDSPLSYYSAALLVFLPYFFIPAGAAVIVATAITLLMPAHRKRELLLLILIAGLYGLYLLATVLSSQMSDAGRINVVDIIEIVSFLSLPNTVWSPSYWAATVLGEALVPTGKSAAVHLGLLYSMAISILALAFLLVRLLHFVGYSRSSGGVHGIRRASRRSQQRLLACTPFWQSSVRALVSKEFRTAARDVTQSFQAVLLLGLCAIYLYMLKLQNLFNQIIPEAEQLSWRLILVTVNACLEAFVITSMGTRLVFPSISREAQAFWVLQASPVPLKSIIRIKFYAWWIPIAIISSLVFGMAALTLYSSPALALFKIFANTVLCFGLVGLGMGLGTYFADFDWEHPSQLVTSFGSLFYMVSGVLLIAFNLFIGGVIISLFFIRQDEILSAHPIALAMLFVSIGVLVALNYLVARISLRVGQSALEKRF